MEGIGIAVFPLNFQMSCSWKVSNAFI